LKLAFPSSLSDFITNKKEEKCSEDFILKKTVHKITTFRFRSCSL
jgi:hypothetical protein